MPLGPANAQRAQDNAVTAAADAFGTTVGNQSLGLYTPSSARGFSPTDAGNIRIAGLYFDQQTAMNPFLFSGSVMRVGIAAQSYAFPAPSGIADQNLRYPAPGNGASFVLTRGPFGQSSAEADSHFRISESVSVGLNFGLIRDFDYLVTPFADRQGVSLLMQFQPRAGFEILPFLGYVSSSERQFAPTVYADRVDPPPLFDVSQLQAQDWTRLQAHELTAGVIAKVPLKENWSVRTGIFRSLVNVGEFDNDLLLGLQPNRFAEQVVDIAPASSSGSYSGDIRIQRLSSHHNREHELTFTARVRSVQRVYGGDSITDLGETSIERMPKLPEPLIEFTGQSRDHVQQTGIGVSYTEHWVGRGSVSIGMLSTNYRRNLDIPGVTSATEHLFKTLPTASFSANLSKNILLYGSYTRGLEDSTPAPSTALNRGEPPPATPTSQMDGGVRITLQPHLTWVAGVFEVDKSYFNLDQTNRYAKLGDISARGIETSMDWTGPKGLTVITGACWLRPEVSRQVAELGGDGSIPVGPVPRTINVNVDYAPSSWKGLGASLQWTSFSSRVETSDDKYALAPYATLNLTARYNFNVAQHSYSARLEADNVTNETALTLSTAYWAFPQPRRSYMFTLSADL